MMVVSPTFSIMVLFLECLPLVRCHWNSAPWKVNCVKNKGSGAKLISWDLRLRGQKTIIMMISSLHIGKPSHL
jgi:hypothetical protein